MSLLKIAASSLASLCSLFILTKLMGNRQMSQLSMFDYVSSIALGSVAGEMAIMSTGSVIEPLISMLIFSSISIAISLITCKSIILRRFFEGHIVLLYQNGQVFEKNLLKAKMDMDEFLSLCRVSGYYDLEEIHTVYLENNGRISVLPISNNRPATPADLNTQVTQSLPLANVIIDGKIIFGNLRSTGKNETWINQQLKAKGITDIKQIILANYDGKKDKLNIYLKNYQKKDYDIFQ